MLWYEDIHTIYNIPHVVPGRRYPALTQPSQRVSFFRPDATQTPEEVCPGLDTADPRQDPSIYDLSMKDITRVNQLEGESVPDNDWELI